MNTTNLDEFGTANRTWRITVTSLDAVWRRLDMSRDSMPLNISGSISRGLFRPRRNAIGLTTLEWLLIVAAVAGLAALAVVLVQNVVDETAEEITGNSARETAAKVAAARITSDAVDAIIATAGAGATTVTAEKLKNVNSEFKSKCDRLKITYSDADITSNWTTFSVVSGSDAAELRTKLAANKACTVP